MQQLYNCFQRIRRSTFWSAAMLGASARTRLDEMLSAFLAKSVETFTLELPKGDTAFLKTLARKMGWTLRSNRRMMSARFPLFFYQCGSMAVSTIQRPTDFGAISRFNYFVLLFRNLGPNSSRFFKMFWRWDEIMKNGEVLLID